MKPTVSVALCTYNGERFIAVQVESILAQNPLPDEVVISDDASTDSTVTIAESAFARFSSENPSSAITLRVLRNPVQLGVVRNFEQAVSATTGDFVTLCDQDDRWEPGRIERALAAFAAGPELLLVHTDANLIDGDGDPLGDSLSGALAMTARERELIRSGKSLVALLRRNLVTGATTMFRRDLLASSLPFPSVWVHDEWLAIVAAATGGTTFVPERLIDYRQHGANAIGAKRLGFSEKIDRLREPRQSRNELLVTRATELVDRLTALGPVVGKKNLELAKGKLAHERLRLGLPASRFLRIGPVFGEFVRGRYSAYGRGLQDVLRDLVQPPR